MPVLSRVWQMCACLMHVQSLSLENVFLSTSRFCAFSLLKSMILIDLILFPAQALRNPWNFCSDSLIELQVSYSPKPAFKDE